MSKLIEKIWFHNHCLQYFSAPLLWPLSQIFSLIARHRRNRFLKHPNTAYRPPVPVIIVGNITVGGNGKTPVVVWLVEHLKRLGYQPGVISRGYGGQAAYYPLVVNENTQPQEAGDEPVLIFRRSRVPVSVSPNRQQAIEAILPLGVDIIISDDGLQHYALARDLEIVVVDGNRRFGNQHYLPFGPLREGLERLKSVDYIICNGGLAQVNETPMSLVASDPIHLRSGEVKPLSAFDGVVAMAGIGHPQRFFDTLKNLGVTVVETHAFDDHHAFTLDDLKHLMSLNCPILMTEKDAVKCQYLLNMHKIEGDWWYLPVESQLDAVTQEHIFARIQSL